MKHPSDSIYLHHMLDAIALARSYVAGADERSFQSSSLLQSAVAHQVQVVGEAARLISPELRTMHPEVPWSSITGMRNRIVHDYINVNPRMVWIVVRDDLPALHDQLNHILQSLEPDPNAT